MSERSDALCMPLSPAGSTCTTWVQVDGAVGAVRLATVMQELMHNTGLFHSERCVAEPGCNFDVNHQGIDMRGYKDIWVYHSLDSWKCGPLNASGG